MKDGATRITPSHLREMGGKPIAAQFPPEAGGGYLGFVEVLHQIHCVVRRLMPLLPNLVGTNGLRTLSRICCGSTFTRITTRAEVRSFKTPRKLYWNILVSTCNFSSRRFHSYSASMCCVRSFEMFLEKRSAK